MPIARNDFPAPAGADKWTSSCKYLESSLSFSAWWFVSCEEDKRLAAYWLKNDVLSTASSSVIPRFSKALFSRKAMSSLSTASLSRCFSWMFWMSKSTAKQGIPFWSRDSCTDFTWSFVTSCTIFFKESFPNTFSSKSFSKKSVACRRRLVSKHFPVFWHTTCHFIS